MKGKCARARAYVHVHVCMYAYVYTTRGEKGREFLG